VHVNHKRAINPILPCMLRQQLGTKVGVLVAITGHGPTLPIGGKPHHHSGEQYSAVFEELSKKIAAEDESDALYLDREVTEYSDLKTGSETDLENNPVLEEYRNSNTNVCNINSFNL
ncbi:hypothetical protein AVEN_263215-1, partial [Araneus ventricosus]